MGLIQSSAEPQQAMQQPEQPVAQQPNDQAQMEQLNKVVMAAQTVMYDKSTHNMMVEHLDKTSGGPTRKAGSTAAHIMGIVKHQTGDQIDARTLISAGMIVVSDVLDFISQTTGQKFDERQEVDACEVYLTMMGKMFGGAQ